MTTKELVKKEDSEISITKTYDMTKPVEVIGMAKTLKNYIVSQKLYSEIKGRNYAMVEGWQFAGFLSGMNAMVEEPKDMSTDSEVKWFCATKIYDREGKVVGIGFALCSSKEPSKKGFDEYAILSMAQTRSIGKAYRNKIGWIMKLAGYEATPKEEMDQVVKEEKKESQNVQEFMEDLQPSDEDVAAYQDKLESARDKKELQSFWSTTPPFVKTKLERIKDNLKAKLK